MAGVFNHFVHPGTVKQGYLVKSPPLDKKLKLDGWRKRWCVFTIIESEPCLDYYEDEEKAFKALPIKRIPLLNCYQVISDMKHKAKKHIFALHLPERVYYFSAPSHAEMVEWVEVFCTNLKLSRTDGGTMPPTPPLYKRSHEELVKSATLPPALSASSPTLPRSRIRDSPLPPIPQTSESPLPPPPDIPVPPIPLETSCLNSSPKLGPPSSPLQIARSAPLPARFAEEKENNVMCESEGTKVRVSPPALPPHQGPKCTTEKEDDTPLLPPTPPPRRISPVPPLSSPPIITPDSFQMEGDTPPPTPPPRTVGNTPQDSIT